MTSTPARGPVDATVTPRYGGPATFARLPRLDEVERADVAVVGVPFDSGVSYRPGARFGPAHVRASSKLLRDFNPVQDVEPFAVQQVVDAGDISCNPFDISEAVRQIDEGARAIVGTGAKLMTIGGDHTIALPLLRVDARDARPGRGGALRCPPGHLGHLLRRAHHPRHAVPSGERGGPGRQDRQHARRHPGAALLAAGPHRRPGPRLPGGRCARHGRPRVAWRRGADQRPRGRPADLRLAGHRRARPGVRARAPARPRRAA